MDLIYRSDGTYSESRRTPKMRSETEEVLMEDPRCTYRFPTKKLNWRVTAGSTAPRSGGVEFQHGSLRCYVDWVYLTCVGIDCINMNDQAVRSIPYHE